MLEKYLMILMSAPVPTAFLSAYFDIALSNLLGTVSTHIMGYVYESLTLFPRYWDSTLNYVKAINKFIYYIFKNCTSKQKLLFLSLDWSPGAQLGSNSHIHTDVATERQLSKIPRPCRSINVTWTTSAMLEPAGGQESIGKRKHSRVRVEAKTIHFACLPSQILWGGDSKVTVTCKVIYHAWNWLVGLFWVHI